MPFAGPPLLLFGASLVLRFVDMDSSLAIAVLLHNCIAADRRAPPAPGRVKRLSSPPASTATKLADARWVA